MNIIIVGGGKFGATLVDCLVKEGHDITLIDTNSKVVDGIVGRYDVFGMCGNGANVDVLREANVDKVNILIAATPSDEVNVLCALIAKKLGAHHTVARVRDPEYSNHLIFMRRELGISLAVNPELDAANEISRILRSMRTVKIDSFAKGRTDLIELRVTDESPFIGLRLCDLYKKFKIKMLICAVQRGEDVYIPDGNFELCDGDKIHITASHTDLNELFKLLGLAKQKVRSVFIVGGGTIAYYLARELSESNIRVKIVELSEKRCVELSEKLPKASIVCGNGTDELLLTEEGIDNYDACVALTGIDEENIIISLCAKYRKIPHIISKVNNSSLLRVMNNESIDNAISPKAISANHVVRYVRSKAQQKDSSSSVQTLYKLVDSKIEAVEFIIGDDVSCVGVPLRELKLKPGTLIACIVRNNHVIIPGGDDTIEVNDNVVVVSNDLYLRNLDEILD